MNRGRNTPCPNRSMLLSILLLSGLPAWALDLPPGQSAVVRPGFPPESWSVNAGRLEVIPGGQTFDITGIERATVTLQGATVSGGSQRALMLTISEASVTDSTLTSEGDIGLNATGDFNNTLPGSNAVVTRSNIAGAGRGLNVSVHSTATVVDSRITGTGAVGSSIAGSGIGVTLVGGEALLQASQATGSQYGAGLFSNSSAYPTSRLVLDASSLTGDKSSAILTGNLGRTPMQAEILILNGSTLTSGNGLLLEVGLPTSPPAATSEVRATVDHSDLSGNVKVLAGSTLDLKLQNNATLAGNLHNVRTLNLDNSQVSGMLTQDSQAPGSVTLSNGSRLQGSVNGGQNLTLDASSRLDMVNDSSIGALTLDGGTVNLRGDTTVPQSTFHTLTASSLAGNGTFALGTDLAGHLSDQVNITGEASGHHTLLIQNTGIEPQQEAHAQQVVHTGSGTAHFAVPGDQVDVGTFVYHLEQRATDWYLVQASTGEPGEPENPGDPGDPVISPGTRTVIGLFSAAPTVWYGELGSLRSRLGELRNGRDQAGLWARTYGNQYNVSADDQVDYRQTQQGLVLGADHKIASEGQWLIGVLGGYGQSTLDLRQGSNGRVESYYLGLYSTWLSDEGYYLDALLKVNRFENKADVRMSDGGQTKGDYDNYGVGGSVEAGRHVALRDGWFVEPYVQASALWVTAEDYDLDNGLEARSNKADSLQGKVGTYVGKTIALPGGGFVQPYVKVAAAHEFARSNKVRVNRTTFTDDLSGSRGELGAGLAVQVSDALQAHADIDYSNGKNIEQPWGVNLGLRYLW